MQLIHKYNKGIKLLLFVIDIFSKYVWVVTLEDKKGITIVNAYQSVLDNSERKPNKIWVDQGKKFYSKSFKTRLEDNDIEMYSTYNEGKSVVAERFIRRLKNKIYKHMAALSKKVYFKVIDDIVDKYNNTYHNSIKMKLMDVKSNSYAEYNIDSNAKDPEFRIDHHVRISKDKNIFAKGYAPNLSEEG